MRWWRSIRTWRPWLLLRLREDDLERGVRAHLELEAEKQQEAGLSPGEARYAAQRAFGNVTLVKEDVRRGWGWATVERLAQDLRLAVRQFRKSQVPADRAGPSRS